MLIRPFPIMGFLGRRFALATLMCLLAGPSFGGVSFSLLEQLSNYGQGRPTAIDNAGQIAGLQFDADLPFSGGVSDRYITNPGTLTYQAATWDPNRGLVVLGLTTTGFFPPTALSIDDAGHALTMLLGLAILGAAIYRTGDLHRI